MKRVFAMLTVLCMLAALCLPVFAAGDIWIADRANLLTEEEELLLHPEFQGDCGVYAVTVEDYWDYGSTPQEAAEDIWKHFLEPCND